jgi:tellurite resistance protein TerC
MEVTAWGWIGFNVFILVMLALDLGVFHRRSHIVSVKEALTWSGVWITLAMLFCGGLYVWGGSQLSLEFLTGYLIEKSLSVDNVFVFAVLFASMRVPKHCEHKILFWGIFGALLMRASMIFAGVALIQRFHWLIYVFGAFLVFTGIRLIRPHPGVVDPQSHWIVRVFRRLFRVTPDYVDDRFLVRRDGVLWATPLLLVLILVETTDLIFALDSIPAILSVSNNTFIVYTSNVFAMLGLRSLYFALSGMMDKFSHLKYGLAGILVFVGGKMTLVDIAPIPIALSLMIVASILALSVGWSLWKPALDQSLLPDARQRI